MKKNKGLTLISLVVTIIILLIMAGVSINMIIGENGVLTQATTVEEEYNKGEVLEELNVMITEKYLDAYSKASGKLSENGQLNLSQYYTGDKVIAFLRGWPGGESGDEIGESYPTDKPVVIENLNDSIANGEADAASEDCYFINLNQLNRSITKYGKEANGSSKDYFYIQGRGENYKVIYRNLQGEPEIIGDLQIQQSL